MPVRKKDTGPSEAARQTIQVEMILGQLHGCVDGTVELSASQISAARVLLNKVLPDLSTVTNTGTIKHEAGDSIKALMEQVNGRTRSR